MKEDLRYYMRIQTCSPLHSISQALAGQEGLSFFPYRLGFNWHCRFWVPSSALQACSLASAELDALQFWFQTPAVNLGFFVPWLSVPPSHLSFPLCEAEEEFTVLVFLNSGSELRWHIMLKNYSGCRQLPVWFVSSWEPTLERVGLIK